MLAIGFDELDVDQWRSQEPLTDHTMRVATAADAVVNASRVDAVVIDLFAASEDVSLIRRIRSAAPTVGVVVVGPADRVELSLSSGAHEVLSDLHGSTDLRDAISRAVLRARAGLVSMPVTMDSVFSRVPAPMFRTLLNGEILQANGPMARLLGFDEPAELIGKDASDFYVDPTVRGELMKALREHGSVHRSEIPLRRQDGRAIWTAMSSYIVTDGFDRPLYTEGVIIDVSDLVHERRRSTTAEAVYRLMFSHSPVPLWELDYSAVAEQVHSMGGLSRLEDQLAAGDLDAASLLESVKLRHANAAANVMLGQENGARLPFSIAQDDELAIAQLRAVASGDDQFVLDVSGVGRDGAQLDVRLLWLAGQIEGLPSYSRVVVAAVDETAMHEHRRALERLVESKDAFISSVAHHLRTPLTAILGFGSELHDHPNRYSESETKGMLGELVAATRAATNVVEDMAVAARTELDTLAFRRDRVDVDCLVAEVVADLAPTASVRGSSPDVLADRARTRQILRALLSNALHHGGESIWVDLSPDADSALIDVSDDGPGIPHTHTDEIFEPYVSGPVATTPSPIGLGLSVARRLARHMGGDLEYLPDTNTVFRLRLPRYPQDG